MTEKPPYDFGVEILEIDRLAGDEGKEAVRQRVRSLMRDKEIWTVLDHDLGGSDWRPGRAAYVLDALIEELEETFRSTRDAANCLVLSAVRAAAAFEQKRDREQKKKYEARRRLEEAIRKESPDAGA